MNEKSFVTYEMIAKALFENYESIYDIDVETNAYKTYFQSDSYQELELSKQGDDFFRDLSAGVNRTIAIEDRSYVLGMLQKSDLLEALEREKYCTIVYQIDKDGQKLYHQLRATLQPVEGGMHILMGVKNIDNLIRRRISQRDAMEAMREKEKNHLEAILATAAAYMEANLSNNRVLDRVTGHLDDMHTFILDIPSANEISEYDVLQKWIAKNRIVKGKEKFKKISSRKYLLECFLKGEKRASVDFSVMTDGRKEQPCKAVYYLYQEQSTKNVHVLCVIYDLTEQQRQEQEMKALETELLLSRIRNSTSQMQPHFLYNALGSIQEVILIDPQYASDLLGDFTVHLRSCVRAMTTDESIPFADELKNIQAYVNIEKMRLGEKLDVEYDIQTTDFMILPLCIQPLVENAIRHGVYKKGKTGGKVVVRTMEENDSVFVLVEDNGVGFDVPQLFRGIEEGKIDSAGLKNICFRLEKVMKASVDVKSKPGEGTTVTICLPKEAYDESNHS